MDKKFSLNLRKKCKICKKEFSGRSDKIFCSVECKSIYHVKLRAVTKSATKSIDKILHRNRSILLEVMGKNIHSKKLSRSVLDNKKFHFGYITNYHINKQGKTVNYVYDFSWMIFSDQEVLIKRIR